MKHAISILAMMAILVAGCKKETIEPAVSCQEQAAHVWSQDSAAAQLWFDMTTAAVNDSSALVGTYLDSLNAVVDRNNEKVLEFPCGDEFTHLHWDTVGGLVEPIE